MSATRTNVRVTVLVFIFFSNLCLETKNAIATPLLPVLALRIGQEFVCDLRTPIEQFVDATE
jgi:hypothetical protein